MAKRKPPTVAKLKKQAWKLLSELVRRQNADWDGWVECYTCGAVHQWNSGLTGMHAGHAIHGRDGAVLLDEEIVRPQCHKCNAKPPYGRGGEYHAFAAKLVKEKAIEIGGQVCPRLDKAMDWWERKLTESRQVRKWSRADLIEKIEAYKLRLSLLAQTSPEQRA